MGRQWSYLKYIVRHKWYVLKACTMHGIFWRGLIHDLSKFLPDEWFPYARFFYNKDGSHRQIRDETGYYKPTDTGNQEFDLAWLYHQKRNRHHWQYWILPEDDGGVKVLDMPWGYVLEMMCDWQGASLAQNHGIDIRPWYRKNKDKMQLSDLTRKRVETLLKEWYGGV